VNQTSSLEVISSANTDRIKTVCQLGRGMIWELAMSPDGKTLGVSSSLGIWLYAMQALDAAPRLLGSSENCTRLTFNPDGTVIAFDRKDKTARRWNAASGQTFSPLSGFDNVLRDVAFSPDGQKLASESNSDRIVWVWDVASGQLIISLSGYAKALTSLAFSHDGRRLAAGSVDGTVRLWTVTKIR